MNIYLNNSLKHFLLYSLKDTINFKFKLIFSYDSNRVSSQNSEELSKAGPSSFETGGTITEEATFDITDIRVGSTLNDIEVSIENMDLTSINSSPIKYLKVKHEDIHKGSNSSEPTMYNIITLAIYDSSDILRFIIAQSRPSSRYLPVAASEEKEIEIILAL